MSQDQRASRLRNLVLDFTDAFNRDDLEAVMAFFAEDAFYDEFHGARSRGKAAIRAVLEPQFAGAFGVVRFVTEDIIADVDTGKATVRWLCTAEMGGRRRAWRGLDVLRFRGQKIAWKETYAKAPVPHFQEPTEPEG